MYKDISFKRPLSGWTFGIQPHRFVISRPYPVKIRAFHYDGPFAASEKSAAIYSNC